MFNAHFQIFQQHTVDLRPCPQCSPGSVMPPLVQHWNLRFQQSRPVSLIPLRVHVQVRSTSNLSLDIHAAYISRLSLVVPCGMVVGLLGQWTMNMLFFKCLFLLPAQSFNLNQCWVHNSFLRKHRLHVFFLIMFNKSIYIDSFIFLPLLWSIFFWGNIFFKVILQLLYYSPFHKTLPKSNLQMRWISLSFYEMGDM